MVLSLWPPIAVVAMVALGWAVRQGPAPVDDWFQRHWDSPARFLLFFTDPAVVAALAAGTLFFAIYHLWWRFAAAALASPLIAMVLPQILKALFGRRKEGVLAYPSGHVTVMAVVVGMIVLATGAAWWAVLVAVVWCVLGIIGQSVDPHYFSDTVGGVLLGSAIVCVAALTLGHAPHRT